MLQEYRHTRLVHQVVAYGLSASVIDQVRCFAALHALLLVIFALITTALSFACRCIAQPVSLQTIDRCRTCYWSFVHKFVTTMCQAVLVLLQLALDQTTNLVLTAFASQELR